MARPSLAERLSAMDKPDHATEAGAMWGSVRPLLVLSRILMVGMLIIVGEIFDDVRVAGLTIGVWALVLGIPLFCSSHRSSPMLTASWALKAKKTQSVDHKTKNQKEMD